MARSSLDQLLDLLSIDRGLVNDFIADIWNLKLNLPALVSANDKGFVPLLRRAAMTGEGMEWDEKFARCHAVSNLRLIELMRQQGGQSFQKFLKADEAGKTEANLAAFCDHVFSRIEQKSEEFQQSIRTAFPNFKKVVDDAVGGRAQARQYLRDIGIDRLAKAMPGSCGKSTKTEDHKDIAGLYGRWNWMGAGVSNPIGDADDDALLVIVAPVALRKTLLDGVYEELWPLIPSVGAKSDPAFCQRRILTIFFSSTSDDEQVGPSSGAFNDLGKLGAVRRVEYSGPAWDSSLVAAFIGSVFTQPVSDMGKVPRDRLAVYGGGGGSCYFGLADPQGDVDQSNKLMISLTDRFLANLLADARYLCAWRSSFFLPVGVSLPDDAEDDGRARMLDLGPVRCERNKAWRFVCEAVAPAAKDCPDRKDCDTEVEEQKGETADFTGKRDPASDERGPEAAFSFPDFYKQARQYYSGFVRDTILPSQINDRSKDDAMRIISRFHKDALSFQLKFIRHFPASKERRAWVVELPVSGLRFHSGHNQTLLLEVEFAESHLGGDESFVGHEDSEVLSILAGPREGRQIQTLAQLTEFNAQTRFRACHKQIGRRPIVELCLSRTEADGQHPIGMMALEHQLVTDLMAGWMGGLLKETLKDFGYETERGESGASEKYLIQKKEGSGKRQPSQHEIEPLCDDRMPVMTSAVLRSDSEHLGDLEVMRSRMNTVELRYSQLDPHSSAPMYDRRFEAEDVDDSRYMRFHEMGTRYYLTGHSFAFMGNGWFSRNVIHKNHNFVIYKAMFVFVLFYNAILTNYSNRMHDYSYKNEKFRGIRRNYNEFIKKLWFPSITTQIQGRELFSKMMEKFELYALKDEIGEEIKAIDDLQEMDRENKKRITEKAIAVIATVVTIFSIFSFNNIFYNYHNPILDFFGLDDVHSILRKFLRIVGVFSLVFTLSMVLVLVMNKFSNKIIETNEEKKSKIKLKSIIQNIMIYLWSLVKFSFFAISISVFVFFLFR